MSVADCRHRTVEAVKRLSFPLLFLLGGLLKRGGTLENDLSLRYSKVWACAKKFPAYDSHLPAITETIGFILVEDIVFPGKHFWVSPPNSGNCSLLPGEGTTGSCFLEPVRWTPIAQKVEVRDFGFTVTGDFKSSGQRVHTACIPDPLARREEHWRRGTPELCKPEWAPSGQNLEHATHSCAPYFVRDSENLENLQRRFTGMVTVPQGLE